MHEADFTTSGLHFKTRRGNLDWRWQLQSIGTQAGELSAVAQGSVAPKMANDGSRTVQYDRGGVIEQYVARSNSIKQQFVISAPLDLGGNDLVIHGNIKSDGRFEESPTPDPSEEGNIKARWQWRSGAGVVSLNDVTVFDATGAELPATMQVTATETCIAVDGLALAMAAYPVTIDPEIGANDFRISDMGPDGSISFRAAAPAVAYNSANNECLIVWDGDDDTAPLVDDEFEIFGQRFANPVVSVILTPVSPPITILAGGGSFDYNLLVTNHTASFQTFDAGL